MRDTGRERERENAPAKFTLRRARLPSLSFVFIFVSVQIFVLRALFISFLFHIIFSPVVFCFVVVIVARLLQCLTQLHTWVNFYLCVVQELNKRRMIWRIRIDTFFFYFFYFLFRTCGVGRECRVDLMCDVFIFDSVAFSVFHRPTYAAEREWMFLFWLDFPFPKNTIDTIYITAQNVHWHIQNFINIHSGMMSSHSCCNGNLRSVARIK